MEMDPKTGDYKALTELLPLILVTVQALRSLQFYICYYGWGDYKHRQNTCKMNDAFNTFYLVVAVVPYWSRLLQICSTIATIYGMYWDLVVDWGLLQRSSKNRWLRDKLLIPYKGVYFGAMALNILLRFAWMQTVLNFKVSLHRETFVAIVASLEIIRRGIWNFFRLENEHLNNVGKFRAFKLVPLPFNSEDDEDRDV
ncbi:hypothetical protein V6Z12_A13G078300 [Gossypium hirsutum]